VSESDKSIVERQLTNESGIKRIDVDYITDSVIIEFDPSVITKEEIKTSICSLFSSAGEFYQLKVSTRQIFFLSFWLPWRITN
jgi:copper chaperone CopZ